jgi:hypothetical protein
MMRVPKVLVDLVEWRWAPAAALSLGAVFYVGLVVAVIPERIGASRNSQTEGRLFTSPASTSLFAARVGASLDGQRESVESESAPPAAHRTMPAPAAPVIHDSPSSARRGFSPPLPRPEPEAAPPPLPPPPGMPPPPPVPYAPPNPGAAAMPLGEAAPAVAVMPGEAAPPAHAVPPAHTMPPAYAMPPAHTAPPGEAAPAPTVVEVPASPAPAPAPEIAPPGQ